MSRRHKVRALLALAVTLAVWSTTFAGLRAALEHFSPGHLVVLRWGIASVLLVAYGLATGMKLPARRDLPAIVLAGGLGFTVYQVALAWGQTGLSAGTAGFLINLAPVLTALLAATMRLEALTWKIWTGLAVSSAGVVLLGLARDGFGGSMLHAALVALAALSFAGYVIVSKPLLGRYSPVEVTTYAIVAGSLPFLVFAPGALGAFAAAAPAGKLTLLYLALLPASLAYIAWAYVLASVPASVATRTLYLVPVLGLVVARIWLGETPGALAIVGGVVILAGVAIASAPSAARRRRIRVALAPVTPTVVASGKNAA